MINAEKLFYIDLIEQDFMPYWQKFYDYDEGGILNCINNYGDKKIGDDKFTWSQGRYLWVLAHVYELATKGVLQRVNQQDLLVQMNGTYDFIVNHAIYGDSVCCYLLNKKGEKIKDAPTGRYDASIFADCFALIGLANYARVLKNEDAFLKTRDLYSSIVKRIEAGGYLTEPYPIPKGYKIHSIPMILINTTYEYIKLLELFGEDTKKEVAYGLSKVKEVLEDFEHKGIIREHISTDENHTKNMLDRHVNAGHTLEDMWFCIEFLKDYGTLSDYISKIERISKNSFALGWDTVHGGLLRFVDCNGGQPKGELGNSSFEKLIVDTWDMKLWWPHSEILYLFLYLYEITGKREYWDYYEKSKLYVFDTFPNNKIGEWIQIRKRDGSPEEKLVALPVKDPFHILRNFIKIVNL